MHAQYLLEIKGGGGSTEGKKQKPEVWTSKYQWLNALWLWLVLTQTVPNITDERLHVAFNLTGRVTWILQLSIMAVQLWEKERFVRICHCERDYLYSAERQTYRIKPKGHKNIPVNRNTKECLLVRSTGCFLLYWCNYNFGPKHQAILVSSNPTPTP